MCVYVYNLKVCGGALGLLSGNAEERKPGDFLLVDGQKYAVVG